MRRCRRPSAWGLVTRGRFDEALPYFEGILHEPAVEGTGVQGAALNNAGLCHARLGQFERAIALQRQAIQVQRAGAETQNYAQALGEMGSTYLLQDDYARSTGYLQQAFNIAAEAGLASDAALFARNLAAAFVALNRWDDAARFNREAARFAQGSGPASPYALGDGREDCRGSWTIRRGRAPVRRGAGRRGRRAGRSVDVSRGPGAARAFREPAVGRRPSLRVGVADGRSAPGPPCSGPTTASRSRRG